MSRVTRMLHHVAPYLTVPYSTVPYRVLRCRKNPRLRRSDAVSLQESQGERKPLWETGKNVENSVENLPQRGMGPVRGRLAGERRGADLRLGALWQPLVRDAGAAPGALAGFSAERKNA